MNDCLATILVAAGAITAVGLLFLFAMDDHDEPPNLKDMKP